MTWFRVGRAEVNQHDGTVELPDDAIPLTLEKVVKRGWDHETVVFLEELPDEEGG